MKTQKLLFLWLIFSTISCNSQDKKINGICFVASRDAINQQHIQPIKKAQSNYIALMPFGFIRDLSSPKIIYNSKRQWFGETENGTRQYAKVFHENGIALMIKPQIWVLGDKYTGQIEMTSEENWKLLEDTYSAFILTYAKTAQELEAAVFCIGTELEIFVANRPLYWQELIKNIKKIYKGKLTYAANWDEYKHFPFWRELDFIGINAYFPLSDKKTPSIQDFENAWQPHKEEIKRIQKQFNKPILFTEFGYRSIDFAGENPWELNKTEGNVNFEAQANGLQAIHNQFWQEDWFAGGFLWKWYVNHEESGGKNNNRFTPQNKSAQKLIEKLYAN